MNVDVTAAGQKVANEPEAPFGDAPGVGAGRNWAHVNSVAYDPSDDSIIISARHQGVVKIGRDKEVKWILAPHTGWKNGLEKKLLTPVDKNSKPIKCTPMGECEGNFDFTYTQHAAWPSASGRGNLTVFDNGQIRHYEQPPLPDMNYSRIVEYKIDPVKMTVQQTWEFGKEKGVDWFAAITSNVQWQKDRTRCLPSGAPWESLIPRRAPSAAFPSRTTKPRTSRCRSTCITTSRHPRTNRRTFLILKRSLPVNFRPV